MAEPVLISKTIYATIVEITVEGLAPYCEQVCHGHKTLYDAIACGDDPRIEEIKKTCAAHAENEGACVRYFIAKITTSFAIQEIET